MTRARVLFVASTALAACAGCSPKGDPRVAVSGRVLLDKTPVTDATIVFLPDLDKSGQGGYGPVWKGHYSIPAEDGPSPGEQNVLVIDQRRENPALATASDRPMIPERYGKLGALHVTIPPNRKSWGFDFDLKEAPGPVESGLDAPKKVD